MEIRRCAIEGPLLVVPRRNGDGRGYLAETFRLDRFEAAAGPTCFVQENHSHSAAAGTVRGLHFQVPPRAQGKLVRVVRGAVVDVALDLRVGSPDYGRHVAARLDAASGHQLWVPPGFAHGFATLEPDTEVVYRLTDYYSHEHERGLRWNDPALGIDWGIDAAGAVVSEKDRVNPLLADWISPFA